ncbi:Para-hydroxybenzoate--polyprenyltransferase, mitochondrial precursor (PHB:polyprenyltransferase) [Phlyctochytrium planicorne]|nr:Para-hydroxybenzoate--polyprenyltransferase, mitochondrial precursor (PHB:polyprenyltransferase) [Phlyctochytrium planicorne]
MFVTRLSVLRCGHPSTSILPHPQAWISAKFSLPLRKHPHSLISSRCQSSKPIEPIPESWKHLPISIVPYLRLARIDRPAGTYLLLLPCTWSIGMATFASFSSPLGAVSLFEMTRQLALFGAGAFIMRGAGCTINDMWDKDIDKKVDRTKDRPLASGQISQFQALVFLGAQLSCGLAILTQLNMYSILLGASSLVLVVAYPLMKRVTHWPQAILGLTFNWGALLGWSAVLGSCTWPVVLPLYFSGVCWTLVYDTIYALQDKDDDVKVGVKSTALYFGSNVKLWLSLFASLSVASLAVAGYANGHTLPFYLVSVGGSAIHYLWTISKLETNNRFNAASLFKSSKWFGVAVFGGVLLDLAKQRLFG